MDESNNDFNDAIRTAIDVLTWTSFVLVLISLTNLGQMKVFQFVLGEVAAVTAIAYSLWAARGVSKYAPFGIVVWFGIASISFAQAIWLVAR